MRRRSATGYDVRFTVRCAMFVGFVLLGAALAEWQALHEQHADRRQAQSLRPLEGQAGHSDTAVRSA